MAKPDYTLKTKARDSKHATRVGAAWNNAAGGINIKLDPGIALTGGEGVDITLWPYEEYQGGNGGAQGGRGGGQHDGARERGGYGGGGGYQGGGSPF